jgi:hypothetical protein
MKDNISARVDQVNRLYQAGDYKLARKGARELSKEALSNEARERIDQILRATGIDSVATMIFLFTLCLFALIIAKFAI